MQNYNSNIKSDLRKRCYDFSLEVIRLTDHLPQKRSAWVISDQLIRSSTSIGANIVEASAASSRLEYKKFFEISLKSANETKYWLGLLKDSGLADVERVEVLEGEVIELSKMIATAVLRLKNKL